MSTTKELIDIIIELKADLTHKNVIVEKLQTYIAENSLNIGENMVTIREYDRVVRHNHELVARLEYYEGVSAKKNRWREDVIPRMNDQDWG